jgi:hypothetical protein
MKVKRDHDGWLDSHDYNLIHGAGGSTGVAGATSVKRYDGSGRLDDRLTAVQVVGELSGADEARLFDDGVIAICGGDALVRWLRRQPRIPRISILGVRSMAQESIAELARSPVLAQIRRLVLVGGGAELEPVVRAAVAVESLVIYEVDALALRAAAHVPCTHLRALRLIGRWQAAHSDTVGELAELLASLSAPLASLELESLQAPIEAIAGNSALAALRTLGLRRCHLRGGELLATMQSLVAFRAPQSHLDDEAIVALARCARLEDVEIDAPELTDAAAIAIAGAPLPALRSLVLGTGIGNDGFRALERSTTLPALTHLRFWERPLASDVRLAFASSERGAFRNAVAACVRDVETWRPQAARPDPTRADRITLANTADGEQAAAIARERGWWPAPPDGVTRSFVVERVNTCTVCYGGGWGPEGHCAYHMDPELERLGEAAHPPTGTLVALVCRTAPSLQRAEQLCVEIARHLADRGLGKPLRHIAWHPRGEAWSDPQPPPPIASLVARLGPVAFASTLQWPYVCELAAARRGMPDPIFAAASELATLGYWFAMIEDDTFHLVMHAELAPGSPLPG